MAYRGHFDELRAMGFPFSPEVDVPAVAAYLGCLPAHTTYTDTHPSSPLTHVSSASVRCAFSFPPQLT